MTRLRLFVSSPSDVRPERARVDVVADRLNGELEGLAQIEVVRWETGFYTADRSFQEAIDTAVDNMRGTDMVVCILWKRVGSELNPTIWRRPDGTPYESGTVLEFEAAVEVARQQNGTPDAYLFRKHAPITYAAETYDVERTQHQLLETVWKRWTTTQEGHNVAGYQQFDDADDFEAQLELCLRQWLERKGVVVKAVWERTIKGSPFRGLATFEAEHAAVFFGREAPIARAVAKLRQAEQAGMPFLVLVGASGAGKSSLLRAGLAPRLTRSGTIPGIDLWRSALVVPAGDPLASLAEALFAEGALGAELRAGDFRTPELLARCLAAGGDMAVPPLRAALERAARQRAQTLLLAEPRPARLLIALDQVERMFVEAGRDAADAFGEVLRALATEKLATIVVALRSDAYALFQKVPGFVAMLAAGGASFDVLPPSAPELEDIVAGPVAACDPPLVFDLDDKGLPLAERLVADAKGGDALPLLQMTLQRLYEAEAGRGDGVLRFADYPGIDEAVARAAQEAIATLTGDAVAALPALLTALVGDVTHDAAAGILPVVVPVERVGFERGVPGRAALIDAFIESRLLTAEHSEGSDRIRPTHDALLRRWPEARHIIAENAGLIRVRHTLEPIAADWEAAEAGAKAGYLVNSAALLAGAERLAAGFGDDLTPAMAGLIAASLAADAARRNAEQRRQRRVLAVTTAGLVVALILAGLAGWQWRIAQAQRARAQHTLVLATQTANGLIFDLAKSFRNFGLPARMVANILGRSRKLQEQLQAGGESTPELRRSQAAGLIETADTLRTLGDLGGALAAARQAHGILEALSAELPDTADYRGELSVSDAAIGDVLRAQGDLAGALAAYRDSLAIRQALALKDPGSTRWQRDVSLSQQEIGDVLRAQGHLDDALAAYRQNLAAAKTLALKNPASNLWQVDLSASEERIGDVLKAQGHLDDALTAYRDSLAIRKAVTRKSPGNTEWQRDLAVNDSRIGDVLGVQGHLDDALAAYRDGMAIIEALARKDPGNTGWKLDLSIGEERIGDMLKTQGHLDAALKAYRDSLAIRKALVLKDPGNTGWQRDLELSDDRIGDMLRMQGHADDALAIYRDGLAISKALALKDPGNMEWQRDLSFADIKIGDAAVAQGHLDDALAAYRDSLAIRKELVLKDPVNTEWQNDLSAVDVRIGDVLRTQGHLDDALAAYRDSLAVRKALTLKDPGNPAWQRDLSLGGNRIGDVLKTQGRLDDARAAYRDGLAGARTLALKEPGNADWQGDVVIGLYKLAAAGADAEANLTEALAILQRLDAAGALPPNRKGWIDMVQRALAALRKS